MGIQKYLSSMTGLHRLELGRVDAVLAEDVVGHEAPEPLAGARLLLRKMRIATQRRPGAPRPDALATGGESVSLSDKRLTPYVATRTCARVAAILTRAPEVCGTAPFWRRSAG